MKYELRAEPELDAMAGEWLVKEKPEPERAIPSIEHIPRLETISSTPIQWAVDGLIAMGAVTALTSESGHGKSTFAARAGYEISRGGEFLGRACTQHPVLVLDVENPHAVLLERFKRLRIETSDNFRVWGGWLPEEPPAAGGAIVLEWIARTQPRPLIIVDSLIGFHPGMENDSTETRRYMGQYRKLAEMGAGVLLQHHTGKSETSKDYRGSSDIKASIDIGYHLANLSENGTLGTMRLRAFKQRFSVTPELVFRYVDGEFIMEAGSVRQTVSESLAELLKAHPGVGVVEFEKLAADKGLGRNRARRFLEDGIHTGMVIPGRGERNRKTFTWGEAEGVLFS